MLTPKQKDILNFLRSGAKKKSEIVEKFKWWYYANADKHVGDVLSRMVKSNIIVRESIGVYCLNTNKSTSPEEADATGQTSLF